MQYSQEHLKTMVYAKFGGGKQSALWGIRKWRIVLTCIKQSHGVNYLFRQISSQIMKTL